MEKKDTRKSHRTYLGRTATETANGTFVDPEVVMHIGHPKHPLHKGLFDATRYQIDNPKFAALLEVTRRMGCPAAVHVRIDGTITDSQMLRAAEQYPDKGHKEEPQLQVICGNRRLAALLIANAERQREGIKPYRLPIVYRPVNDALMRQLFVEENEIRDGNGLYQRLLIVEDTFARGEGYDALVTEFGMPAKEIARIFNPMRGANAEVAKAYATGRITLTQLKRLNKYTSAEAPDRLLDCIAKRGDFAPKAASTPKQPKLSARDKTLVVDALRAYESIDREAGADLRDLLDRLSGWAE